MKVDEKWISFDRVKGSKERSCAEAVTGNLTNRLKNIISRQNQFKTSSNLRDNSTMISSKAENKIEENLFTIDDKWVTNERKRRKCKRSNIEKMKFNGIGISEYGGEESDMVENNVGNFKSQYCLIY